jgi:hypothetical protein
MESRWGVSQNSNSPYTYSFGGKKKQNYQSKLFFKHIITLWEPSGGEKLLMAGCNLLFIHLLDIR